MLCGSRTKPLPRRSLITARQRQQDVTLSAFVIIGNVLLSIFLPTTFSLDSSLSMLSSSSCKAATAAAARWIRIPRHVWRPAALQHQERVRQLLEPVLLPFQEYTHQQSLQRLRPRRKLREGSSQNDNLLNCSSIRSNNNKQQLHIHNDDEQEESSNINSNDDCWFRPLDPRNPVCNFLIEYYGLKGLAGVKRLARWNPSPNLLLLKEDSIMSLHDLQEASSSKATTTLSGIKCGNSCYCQHHHHPHHSAATGVFLEDVTIDDFATLLHLRGAIIQDNGALYSPYQWFNAKQEHHQQEQQHSSLVANVEGRVSFSQNKKHPASASLWFRSILQQTLQAEPILHCHGLQSVPLCVRPE